jgi:predicted alpha/beta hydrolase family esterase
VTRVVYLHGDGVLDWRHGWVPGVQRDLEAAGLATWFELLPDSIEARARYWLPFLRDVVRAGADDVLLGWSCGAVAAMRYAEERPVRGLVLVAPYFTDLGLDEVRRAGWADAPWDWARIRAHAPHIAMFHSDADPYVAGAEFAALAGHLGADVHAVPGAGHFGEQTTFPAVSELVIRRYAS